MFNSLKIGTRLALGFGVLILAAVAAFAAAMLSGRSAQADTALSARHAAARGELVHDIMELQLALVSSIRNAGLQTSGGDINQDVNAYRKSLAELREKEVLFAAADLSADERATLEQAIALRKQAEPLAEEAVGFAMAFAPEEAAKLLTTRLTPVQAQWSAQLGQLATLQRQRAAAEAAAIGAAIDRRGLLLAGALAVVVLAAVAFALALTRSVTRPLQAAVGLAERVAQGDLNLRIEAHGSDEAAQLLRSLQAMATQLSTMVKAVRESSDSIAVASVEISGGNIDLSGRTERAAASLQQTSASLDLLAGSVADNAGHARDAQSVVASTGRIAEQGGSAMREVQTTMQGISESAHRIAEIISVIDGIAFQTNILALNAAVEAARAGEQGRGFAVVASEVRALAQRVSSASGEVRSLIGQSVERVDAGSRLVQSMGGTMKDLEGGVQRVHDLIATIASAASLQDERIREVSGSVREIDSTTQQNAALVEQVAAAAQSLSGQTSRLGTLVKRFQVAEQAAEPVA